QSPLPVGEDALDDGAHLPPRQAAVAGPDTRHRQARQPFRVRLLAHARQSGLDRVVTGPRPPDALLRAEVEDPRQRFILPQERVPEVELTRLGLAPPAVLGIHGGVAVAELRGDTGAHRPLAVAA